MASGGAANMPPEPVIESQKVPIVVALLLAIPVLCVVIVLLTYKACTGSSKCYYSDIAMTGMCSAIISCVVLISALLSSHVYLL